MQSGSVKSADCTVHAIGMAANDSPQHEIFAEGDNLYDAMVHDIAVARHTVFLEIYILKEDRIGRRILEALRSASKRGVEVHLRLDAFGSKGTISGRTLQTLRQANATVSWSNLWSWRHPLQYQRRNHRKLLIVDGSVAYIGGFNISEESSLTCHGPARWRDTHIRLTGKIVSQAETLFRDFAREKTHWRENWVEGSLLMPNYGLACRYRWRCLLTGRFRRAAKRIWLTTPYFVPDRNTQRRLEQAALQGADVRILVPEKSDVPMTKWAARVSYGNLLRAGAKIYEYRARILHAKTVVIDDDWSIIGTSNLDYRSFFTNYELNFVSRSPALNERLAAIFENDLQDAAPVSYSSWLSRPYLQQFSELVGWAARRWL